MNRRIMLCLTMLLVSFDVSAATNFDGHWWTSAEPDEQQGFIIGYVDCYQHTLRHPVKSDASFKEDQIAISDFYASHPDQYSVTVPSLLAKLLQTLKTKTQRMPGAEVWTDRHGFLDGQYWNEATEKERIGFLEGFIWCYQRYSSKPRLRYTKTVAAYAEILTRYFGNEQTDRTNEKIAVALFRLGDRVKTR